MASNSGGGPWQALCLSPLILAALLDALLVVAGTLPSAVSMGLSANMRLASCNSCAFSCSVRGCPMVRWSTPGSPMS